MDSVSSNPLSLSKFFKFSTSVSCSILTWLIPNLRILQNSMFFSSQCGPRVVYPIINRLIPSPPQFEIRQCHDYNYNRLRLVLSASFDFLDNIDLNFLIMNYEITSSLNLNPPTVEVTVTRKVAKKYKNTSKRFSSFLLNDVPSSLFRSWTTPKQSNKYKPNFNAMLCSKWYHSHSIQFHLLKNIDCIHAVISLL